MAVPLPVKPSPRLLTLLYLSCLNSTSSLLHGSSCSGTQNVPKSSKNLWDYLHLCPQEMPWWLHHWVTGRSARVFFHWILFFSWLIQHPRSNSSTSVLTREQRPVTLESFLTRWHESLWHIQGDRLTDWRQFQRCMFVYYFATSLKATRRLFPC